MGSITSSRSNLVVFVGCLVVSVGSFLTWLSSVSEEFPQANLTVRGIQGDGKLTVLLAIAGRGHWVRIAR